MAIVLTKDFDSLIDSFDTLNSNLDLSESKPKFNNSNGVAIERINTALRYIHNAHTSLGSLYGATSVYLNKVKDNFQTCETNNSVEVVREE